MDPNEIEVHYISETTVKYWRPIRKQYLSKGKVYPAEDLSGFNEYYTILIQDAYDNNKTKDLYIDENFDLEKYKQSKISNIAIKNDQLLKEGFLYKGKNFTLSIEDRSNYIGIHTFCCDNFTPGISVITKDFSNYVFEDQSDVFAWFATGLAYVDVVYKTGAPIKDLIAKAESKEVVDNIQDTRTQAYILGILASL